MDDFGHHECANCIWSSQCGTSAARCADFTPFDTSEDESAEYITTIREDVDYYYASVRAEERGLRH